VRVLKAQTADAVEFFHFGEGQSLYGVLHGSRPTNAAGGEATLICSPIGQECVRTHFVLQRLARRLAAEGIPTLRFDYYGCRDSLGDSVEASCDRWQTDIADACEELRRRTNATDIAAVGVRLGATLLCNVVGRIDLSRVVLWDPIGRGAEYLAELARGHEQCVRAARHLRFRRAPVRTAGGRELLGSTYSEEALEQLKALVLAPIASNRPVAIQWLATSHPERQEALFGTIRREGDGSRIEAVEFDCAWQDMSRLEEVMPDVGIAKKLAEMVMQRS
jgi:hypothetical protein